MVTSPSTFTPSICCVQGVWHRPRRRSNWAPPQVAWVDLLESEKIFCESKAQEKAAWDSYLANFVRLEEECRAMPPSFHAMHRRNVAERDGANERHRPAPGPRATGASPSWGGAVGQQAVCSRLASTPTQSSKEKTGLLQPADQRAGVAGRDNLKRAGLVWRAAPRFQATGELSYALPQQVGGSTCASTSCAALADESAARVRSCCLERSRSCPSVGPSESLAPSPSPLAGGGLQRLEEPSGQSPDTLGVPGAPRWALPASECVANRPTTASVTKVEMIGRPVAAAPMQVHERLHRTLTSKNRFGTRGRGRYLAAQHAP